MSNFVITKAEEFEDIILGFTSVELNEMAEVASVNMMAYLDIVNLKEIDKEELAWRCEMTMKSIKMLSRLSVVAEQD